MYFPGNSREGIPIYWYAYPVADILHILSYFFTTASLNLSPLLLILKMKFSGASYLVLNTQLALTKQGVKSSSSNFKAYIFATIICCNWGECKESGVKHIEVQFPVNKQFKNYTRKKTISRYACIMISPSSLTCPVLRPSTGANVSEQELAHGSVPKSRVLVRRLN